MTDSWKALWAKVKKTEGDLIRSDLTRLRYKWKKSKMKLCKAELNSLDKWHVFVDRFRSLFKRRS